VRRALDASFAQQQQQHQQPPPQPRGVSAVPLSLWLALAPPGWPGAEGELGAGAGAGAGMGGGAGPMASLLAALPASTSPRSPRDYSSTYRGKRTGLGFPAGRHSQACFHVICSRKRRVDIGV
jgi:hypothetical protein